MVRKKEIENGYARRYCKPSEQIFRISVFETDSAAVFWRTGEDVKNGFGLWGHSFCLFKVFFNQVWIYTTYLSPFFFVKFLCNRDVFLHLDNMDLFVLTPAQDN